MNRLCVVKWSLPLHFHSSLLCASLMSTLQYSPTVFPLFTAVQHSGVHSSRVFYAPPLVCALRPVPCALRPALCALR